MNKAVLSALTVWFLLMVGTVASTWGFSLPAVDPLASTIGVMVISAIKVMLVMLFFMELRHAPLPWQLFGTSWVVLTTSAVMTIYLR